MKRLLFAGAFVLLVTALNAKETFDSKVILDQLERGQYAGAIERLRARVDNVDSDARAWVLLGDALRHSGQLDESRLALQRGLDLEQGVEIEALAGLAELGLLAADPALGVEYANRALRILSRKTTDIQDPQTLRAAARAAVLLGREDTKRFRDAVRYLKQAIALDDQRNGARIDLADLLLSKYNNAEASEFYVAAARLTPEHPRALAGVARSQHFDHASSVDGVVAHLVKTHPDYVPGLVLQAALRVEAEDFDRAASILAEALQKDPYSLDALSLLAGVYFLQGRDLAAQRVVKDVRERAPGYTQIFLTLAELAERNRRYAEAAEFALVALNIDRQAWQAHAVLGINRMRTANFGRARRALEMSFRGDPFNVRVKNTLELMDKIDRDFAKLRSDHFVLIAHKSEINALVPLALPLAEQAYAFYRERYQHAPSTPIQLEFYPKHEDFSVRTAGVVGIGILGVSFGKVIALDSPSASAFGPLNWGSVLWHEIAHSFHLSMTRHRMPRWFSEGLAVYEERRARTGWGGDLSPGFVQAFARGELPVASRMNDTFLRPKSSSQLVHGYFQASMFIDFVVRRSGFDVIRQMLAGFAEGLSFERVVENALGLPISDLDAEFVEFMNIQMRTAKVALHAPEGKASQYAQMMGSAERARKEGKLLQARDILLEAMQLVPAYADDDSAYWHLARVEQELKQQTEAAVTLESMLAVNADSLAAHQALASIYQDTGRAGRELNILKRSLFVQPFDLRVHRRLANIYEQDGRWGHAIQARSAVVGLDPSDIVDARFRLANALHRAGNHKDARTAVLHALEDAPMFEDGLELLLDIRSALSGNAAPEAGAGKTQ